jgi:hypothetical protein
MLGYRLVISTATVLVLCLFTCKKSSLRRVGCDPVALQCLPRILSPSASTRLHGSPGLTPTMLINAPQCTSSMVRLGAFAAFVFTCAFFFLPRRYEAPPSFAQVIGSHIKNATETGSTFNASVVEFWQELASAVVATAPQCEPFRIQDEHLHYGEHHFDPLDSGNKAPERLLNFTDQDETALFRAHYKMRNIWVPNCHSRTELLAS